MAIEGRSTRDKHAVPKGEAERKITKGEAERNLNDYAEVKPKRGPGRGRAPGFRMPEGHRLKIQNSNILNYLLRHISGKREMSATQVAAGLGLLKKVLPDLSRQEQTGADGGAIQHTVTIIERRIVDPAFPGRVPDPNQTYPKA